MDEKTKAIIDECVYLLDDINYKYVTEQSYKTIRKVIELLIKA